MPHQTSVALGQQCPCLHLPESQQTPPHICFVRAQAGGLGGGMVGLVPIVRASAFSEAATAAPMPRSPLRTERREAPEPSDRTSASNRRESMLVPHSPDTCCCRAGPRRPNLVLEIEKPGASLQLTNFIPSFLQFLLSVKSILIRESKRRSSIRLPFQIVPRQRPEPMVPCFPIERRANPNYVKPHANSAFGGGGCQSPVTGDGKWEMERGTVVIPDPNLVVPTRVEGPLVGGRGVPWSMSAKTNERFLHSAALRSE